MITFTLACLEEMRKVYIPAEEVNYRNKGIMKPVEHSPRNMQ